MPLDTVVYTTKGKAVWDTAEEAVLALVPWSPEPRTTPDQRYYCESTLLQVGWLHYSWGLLRSESPSPVKKWGLVVWLHPLCYLRGNREEDRIKTEGTFLKPHSIKLERSPVAEAITQMHIWTGSLAWPTAFSDGQTSLLDQTPCCGGQLKTSERCLLFGFAP